MGRKNDYCFRAADAGFSLVIATHTYVFHAKSESYSDSERVTLMKAASETFRSLHGRPRIERAVRTMQENPILVHRPPARGFADRAVDSLRTTALRGGRDLERIG
jgi:GT2 family glycosyltransferase